MKELPYFKFIATEWLAGDISHLSFDLQGVFISLCALYWKNGCSLPIATLMPRFRHAPAGYMDALRGVLEVQDGMIKIRYLDEQLSELAKQHKLLSDAGKRRWIKPPLSHPIARLSNIDKDKEQDKDINTLKGRVSKIFNRREATKWNDKETKKIKEISKRPEVEQELSELEAFYGSDYEYKRRDIETFLNNWNTELDRARGYSLKNSPKNVDKGYSKEVLNTLFAEKLAKEQDKVDGVINE